MSPKGRLRGVAGVLLLLACLTLFPGPSLGQTSGVAALKAKRQPPVETPLPGLRTPAELEAYVDGVVGNALVEDHIVGATVAIVLGDQVLLKKGYGAAGLSPWRPVDPDKTLFRLGSVSKTFTWLTVLKEAESGRLRLDAPINAFLPPALSVRDQDRYGKVTLLNLMSHSGGFEDRTLGHLIERDPDQIRSLEDYLRQERPRRVRAVGEVSSYSNYGAALAGEAAARVSGKTFENLSEASLFAPLGMTRTTFREPRPPRAGLPAPMPAALAADVSAGFAWTGSEFLPVPFEYIGQIAPAGSASSTAGDMARFMIALLNAGQFGEARIYGDFTARSLRQPLRRTPPGINGWRHGFIAYDLPGGLSGLGHDGATLSFMTNMTLVPALGLGVFVSTNTDTGRALTQRLADRVVERLSGQTVAWPRPASPELAAVKPLYEGQYLSSRRAYAGLEGMLARLDKQLQVSVTPEGRLVTRAGGRVRTWAPEGTATSGRFVSDTGWERLVFLPGGSRADRILVSDNTQIFERTPLWSLPVVLGATAAGVGLSALANLTFVLFRSRRDFRQTHVQAQAGVIQGLQSVLWLLAIGLAIFWRGKSSPSDLLFDWPGLLPLAASACALIAGLLSLAAVVLLPFVLRSGRRLDSWTLRRRAGYAAHVLLSFACAVLLGLWGGLSPWAG